MTIAKPNNISFICVYSYIYLVNWLCLWTLEHFVKHYTCIYNNQDLEISKDNGHNNKEYHQYVNTNHWYQVT